MGVKKFESEIRMCPLHILEKGFIQICEMEVEIETKLKEIQEAKARFMVEIDLRINQKK